jgi:hypothetical protein
MSWNNINHDLIKSAQIIRSESLVSEPISFKVEITTEKLKMYKSSGTDKNIPVELIQSEGNILHSEIQNLLILFGIRNNCHSSGTNL